MAASIEEMRPAGRAARCLDAAGRPDPSRCWSSALLDTTLLKGLGILEALIQSGRPRGITEFAAELGLTKSNVHRVLKTLRSAGYVQQTANTDTYGPTLKVWELGSRVYLGLDVAREARAALVRLADLTRETVHLSVLDGTDVVYIDKIDSLEPVRAYTTLGGRAPAHCVATGKVLLAFSAEDSGAPPHDFASHTARTITQRKAFLASCADIRAKGYAVNWGEWRESIRGVGAPVFNTYGTVVAAVGISGPAERLTRARIIEATPQVTAIAEMISARLGFRADRTASRRA